MNPNWELRGCCNRNQNTFLITIGIFTVVIFLLWRTFLLTPFKHITVFLHEASHAVACKLTCGDGREDILVSLDRKVIALAMMSLAILLYSSCGFVITTVIILLHQVEGMEVNANEGGSTTTRGGIYWLILPAGYLGSSFWGMALILASTNLLTARIAAAGLGLALFIVLFIAKNWTLRSLCIGFIVFLAVVWVLQELSTVKILRYVILFIGVMNSLFSVYDIYDDLISRRVHSSDAEKFAEICPCCTGCGWGVIWGMISFAFLCASLYLGLVILS